MPTLRYIWIAVVIVSLWAVTAHGHPRSGMGAMGPMGAAGMMGDAPGMLLPMILKGIDLTDAQEKQVREIMTAHRATFRTLSSELQAAHKELANTLLAPGEMRADLLTSQAQRATQLREQLMQQGLKVALEVRAVLTPEQLAKAAEIQDRMRALHTEMRGLFKGKH